MKPLWIALLSVFAIVSLAPAADPVSSPYTAWKNGPPHDASFFPIAVWLQAPANAPRYKDAGINVYVGLWKGPTEQQLAELKKHKMLLICDQNAVALKHKNDPTIIGWMHGDEPDNAQEKKGGKGYGPPILPSKIVADYKKIQQADPSRPILLNLGQGVAWDNYIGRGVRRNHPEDYPQYVQGSDIVSFDIYPACHEDKAVAGKLWFVGDGVSRLRKWSDDKKIVWNCIECTHIGNPKAKATPQQIKCEVWMSLVRGSRGLIYFVHQFKPKFIEAGLLAEPDNLAMVRKVNRQIHDLAPVLNSPTIKDGATVKSSSDKAVIEVMTKHHDGSTYLFAVNLRDTPTTAAFQLAGSKGQAKAEVLGESRKVDVKDGQFQDTFKAWDVHLYKLKN